MATTSAQFDVTEHIIAYEQGELDRASILKMFSYLVSTGIAWQLQGHYGRVSEALIEEGYISKKGRILKSV